VVSFRQKETYKQTVQIGIVQHRHVDLEMSRVVNRVDEYVYRAQVRPFICATGFIVYEMHENDDDFVVKFRNTDLCCACVAQYNDTNIHIYICILQIVLRCALTGGKVAKLNKISSAYQLANIQVFCTG